MATWQGVVPLVAVAILSTRQAVLVAHWWLAVSFAVSFLADNVARWLDPWAVTFVYVISQSAIVGSVFLPRRDAVLFVGVLCVVGAAAVFARDAQGHDYLLHVTGWLGAAGIAYAHAKGRLRQSLLVYFGAGAAAYVVYAGWANWPTWLAYQATRAIGIALFCAAVVSPRPQLRVST